MSEPEKTQTDSITTSEETRKSIERGLKQKGTIDRGSFAKYVEPEPEKRTPELKRYQAQFPDGLWKSVYKVGDADKVIAELENNLVAITDERDTRDMEIARLRKALEFYADEENYALHTFGKRGVSIIHDDRGKRATEALQGEKDGSNTDTKAN